MRFATVARVPTFKNLLCPVDFSDSARHALTVASELAASAGAALTIVHVWQPATYGTPYVPVAPEVIRIDVDETERAVDAWVADAKAAGVTTVASQLITGTAWHEIVQLLEADRSFDLVVMGTHGRTGLTHVLLGSVAERVVRHAPCAVLVVR